MPSIRRGARNTSIIVHFVEYQYLAMAKSPTLNAQKGSLLQDTLVEVAMEVADLFVVTVFGAFIVV
jgi:hypothetical protein